MPGMSPRRVPPKCRRVRRPLGLPCLPAACLLAVSLLAAGAEQAFPATPEPRPSSRSYPGGIDRPEPPPPGTREAATSITWIEGSARRFLGSRGEVWLVVPETAVTGWLVRPGERRPIRQTRLRIEDHHQGKHHVLAWLQHTANTEVSILLPGDRRLRGTGTAVDDSLRPWPNACSLMPYDLDQDIDLNRNGRMELPVRSSVSLPDPAASLILLLEADDDGRPRLVPSREFVGTVRFEEGIITSIRFPAGAGDPVLEGQFLPLYNCRFLARLQIPGQEACRYCCMVPMVLRRDENGLFQPVFDKTAQGGLLIRLETDLAVMQQGGPGPLVAPETAALARAAAFFDLTGVGRGTREQLEKAMGSRANLPQSAQLLGRLDRFFLAPTHPGGL